MPMVFRMHIKDGLKEVGVITSQKPKLKQNFTREDYEKIIEVEKLLERLFDYRFHIFAEEG